MKLLLTALALLMSTAQAATTLRCSVVLEGDNIDPARLEKIETLKNKMLTEVRSIMEVPADRRLDIEVVEYFRNNINPVIKEMGDILRDKTVISEELLTGRKSKIAERTYLRTSKILATLGDYTAYTKSASVNALSLIPGYAKSKVDNLQINVKDQQVKLKSALSEIETENKVLVTGGERIVSSLTEVANQIEIFRRIREALQNDNWNSNIQTEFRKKSREEILRYTDQIIEELIQIQMVSSVLVERIDSAVDRNHTIIHNIKGFLDHQVPMVQGIADRKLDLTPELMPEPLASKAYSAFIATHARTSELLKDYYSKAIEKSKSIYRNQKGWVLFGAIAIYFTTSHFTGFSAYDTVFHEKPVQISQSVLTTKIQEVKSAINHSPSDETKTELIKDFLKKYKLNLSLKDTLSLISLDQSDYKHIAELEIFYDAKKETLSIQDMIDIVNSNVLSKDYEHKEDEMLKDFAGTQAKRLKPTDIVTLSTLAHTDYSKKKILENFKN
jgi:hypothetical protein